MSESSGLEDDEFYDAFDGEDEADGEILSQVPSTSNDRTLTDRFATCQAGELTPLSGTKRHPSCSDEASDVPGVKDDTNDEPLEAGDEDEDEDDDDDAFRLPPKRAPRTDMVRDRPPVHHLSSSNSKAPRGVRSRNQPHSLEDLSRRDTLDDSDDAGGDNESPADMPKVTYSPMKNSTGYKSNSLPLEKLGGDRLGDVGKGIQGPCDLYRTLDRQVDYDRGSLHSGNTSTTSYETKSHSEHSNIIRLPKKNLSTMYSKFRKKTRPKKSSSNDDAHVPGTVTTSPEIQIPGCDFTSCASANYPPDRKQVFCNSRIVQTFEPSAQAMAVWCLKFSPCGKYLAAAGQDKIVRVWILRTEEGLLVNRTSPTSTSTNSLKSTSSVSSKDYDQLCSPFYPDPYRTFANHSSDVMDISWAHNSIYLLSASMDKSVRLWHLPSNKCMGKFDHQNIVTCVAFPPPSETDDVFISGAMDGKVRKWSIPKKKVVSHFEVTGGKKQPITCVSYNNKGDVALVGTLNGCIIKITKDLKEVICFTRTTTSKGKQKKSPIKIVSIQENPEEADVYLVSSSDCRIRLYDASGPQGSLNTPDKMAGNWRLRAKYKGHTNKNCPIRSGFSRLGNYVMSGSECNGIFIWSTEPSTAAKPKDTSFECITAHHVSVTAATFCPTNEPIRCADECEKRQSEEWRLINSRFKHNFFVAEVFASADFSGKIHVFFA